MWVWLAASATLLPSAALAQYESASYESRNYDNREYDRSYGDGTYNDSAPAGYDTGYSYLRTLDGSATLIQGSDYGGSGERSVAEINQPILAGDRLWVSHRSAAEVVLSDGNLLRIDGDSEVEFERLAFSPETDDKATTLRLLRGNVQFVVTTDSLGEKLPRLDTANATIYPQDFGTYRLTADGLGWTELVVRRGRAEVVTDRGALEVYADQRALVDGDRDPWTDVRSAGAFDSLERWAADLDRRADDVPYVDEELRYAAAPMARHGAWVTIEGGSRAWRPHVDNGWRPYWHGRWTYSPAGLVWVSSEPWGWVPYHYGTWDYSSSYGWVWLPGRRFSPGWVYWHWGNSHVAWVPVGYYTRHWHRRYHHGFRFGVYGWAGGSWDHYRRWVFCPRGYFGSRYQRRHVLDGYGYRKRHGRDGHGVPRGILTTDTRRLRPGVWRHGDDAIKALRTRPGRGGRIAAGGDLPDVTAFVHRDGDLPLDVRKRVAVDRTDGTRLAGTPMAPGTKAPGRRSALPRVLADDGGRGGKVDRREGVRTRDGIGRSDAGRADVGRRSAVIRSDARKPDAGPRRAPTDVRRNQVDDRSTPSKRSAVIRSDRPARRPTQRPVTTAPRSRGRAENPAADRPVSVRPRSPRAEQPRAEKPRADRPPVRRPTSRSGDVGVGKRSEVYRAPAPRRSPPREEARSSSGDRRAAPRQPAVKRWPEWTQVPSSRRSAPPSRRPEARRSPAPSQRPSVKRSPGPSQRPTVRRSPPTNRRPSVRQSPGPSQRPSVRRSPPTNRRPSVRQSPAPSQRPRVQRSSPSRRPAPSSSSRSGSGSRRSSASSSKSSSSSSSRGSVRRSKPRPRAN